LGIVGGAVELAELDEHFDGGGFAVCDVDAELDVSLVTVGGVEAVAPLETGLTLAPAARAWDLMDSVSNTAPAVWWPVMRTRQSPLVSVSL